MKKHYLLYILVISLIVSCGKEDVLQPEQVVNQEPDPTIISEYHILSTNGDISKKYIFDNLGNLSKERVMSQDFETHYILITI